MVADAAHAPDEPVYEPARLGDVRASSIEGSLGGAVLGWYPQVSLAEGVRRTVGYFGAT